MEDVLLLPKNKPAVHPTKNGYLKQYQDKLTQKYFEIIRSLQNKAEEMSNDTNNRLKLKMDAYLKEKEKLLNQTRDFLESMGKNTTTFDELRKSLDDIGDKMIQNSISLREESIKFYDQEFSKLQPFVNDSFKKCEIYVTQLPDNLTFRLENVVKQLNESYIATKAELIKSFYNEEINVRNLAADASDEFVQRSDDWKINKFDVLVEEAKEKLDYKKLFDFGTIFTDFYTDQQKFTMCFEKVLQNVTLIMPPDNFTANDFDNWWKEVEEMITFHNNFIDAFVQKIDDKIVETKNIQSDYIENLEKELTELKNENDANLAMLDIVPLYKQCRKYNDNFLIKIKRYWENRSNAIKTAFEAIKNFILPLITMYQDCLGKVKEYKDGVEKDQSELMHNYKEHLDSYENDLKEKINQIQLLVDEGEIKSIVSQCKEILVNIETEYRTYYDQAISIYDTEQPKVLEVFEKTETDLLAFLKLKKTATSQEWMANIGSARSAQKISAPNSVRRQKRPVSRAVKKRQKKSNEVQIIETFNFSLDDGTCRYEETEPLIIIPPLEEFVDEATVPPPPAKGKGRGGRTPPNRGRGGRGTNKSGGSLANQKMRSKVNLDDYEDIEVPNFVLFDTVPNIEIEPEKKEVDDELASQGKSEIGDDEDRNINDNEDDKDKPDEKHEEKQEPKKEVVKGKKEVKFNKSQIKDKSPIREKSPAHSIKKRGGKLKKKKDKKEDVKQVDMEQAESLPTVQKVPMILVFIPDNSEIDDWKDDIRKNLIKSFMKIFNEELKISAYENEREKLTYDLNDKLRKHSTRASSIELNVGQTRLIKIESRRVQLEKHFRKATLIFNKGLKGLETNIDKRMTSIKNDAQTLHQFVEDLQTQKNSQTFQQLNQEFVIRVKNFNVKFSQQMEIQKKELDDFISSFKASNERFVNSLGGEEEIFSEEEHEMCLKFFERMDIQIDHIVDALNNREKSLKSEIEGKVKSITDEFNISFPHHKNDMILIDTMQAAQVEAKSKLDSLMFKNKQNEYDVNRAIENVTSSRSSLQDPQLAIEKEFETLENMRITILNRAKFLNILKSKFNFDPLPFHINLGNELTDAERTFSETPQATPKRTPVRARTSQVRTRPDSAKKPSKRSVTTEVSSELAQTLNGKIDIIGNELLLKINPTINEFYGSLKARKFQITRPDKLPQTANECLEQNRVKWNEAKLATKKIYEESCHSFRNQVVKAVEIAKSSIPYVYSLYLKYYTEMQKDKHDTIQKAFEEEYNKLNKAREKNRMILKSNIYDENNISQLEELINAEKERKNSEVDTIKSFNENMINSEVKSMQLFIGHLPVITHSFLQKFDQFVLPEDLLPDANAPPLEGTRRLTLKEMLKEKERRENNPVNDPSRPFPQKSWILPNAVMLPLAQYIVRPNDPAHEKGSAKKAIVRRKRTPDSKRDSRSNSTNSALDIGQGTEKLPPLNSLETSLHRNTIFEQNKCYDTYNTALSDRILKFKEYIAKLENKTQEFDNHWRECINTLNVGLNLSVPMNDSP